MDYYLCVYRENFRLGVRCVFFGGPIPVLVSSGEVPSTGAAGCFLLERSIDTLCIEEAAAIADTESIASCYNTDATIGRWRCFVQERGPDPEYRGDDEQRGKSQGKRSPPPGW